jgi:hypothetical protein
MPLRESLRNQKSKIEPSLRELRLRRWHLVYWKGLNLLNRTDAFLPKKPGFLLNLLVVTRLSVKKFAA